MFTSIAKYYNLASTLLNSENVSQIDIADSITRRTNAIIAYRNASDAVDNAVLPWDVMNGILAGAGGPFAIENKAPERAVGDAVQGEAEGRTGGSGILQSKGLTDVGEGGIAGSGAKGIGSAVDFGIPNFLNPRQDLHIPPVVDGRSVLTTDPSDLLQGLLNGDFTILRQPKPGQVVVDFSKPIREYWSNGTKVGETQFGSVSYGKKGAHIIPANPNQW